MLISEIKRILKNKYFMISYIVSFMAILALFFFVQYSTSGDNKVLVYIIDNDKSVLSENYINKLKESKLVEITQTGDSERLLKKEKIDAILEIPKGFFVDYKKQMKFKSKSNDLISAAIIDNLAENFISDLGRYMLMKKVKSTFGEKYVDKSLINYDKSLSNSRFELDIEQKSNNAIKGITGEYREKVIAKAKTFFMYATVLLSVVVMINLNVISIFGTKKMTRIKISKTGSMRYYCYSVFTSILFISLIQIIISTITAYMLSLTNKSMIILISLSFVYTMIIYFIVLIVFTTVKRTEYAFSLSLLLIIMLAILGGAFFDVDMMPKAISSIVRYTPFYKLNEVFYTVIMG